MTETRLTKLYRVATGRGTTTDERGTAFRMIRRLKRAEPETRNRIAPPEMTARDRLRRAGLLGLILLVGLASPAQALGPALNHCLFTWTEPPVPSGDLAVFNLYISTTSGGPYAKLGTFPGTPGGGQAYGPTANLCGGQPDGQKFSIIRAQDLAGNESVGSNEVPFVFDGTAPPRCR